MSRQKLVTTCELGIVSDTCLGFWNMQTFGGGKGEFEAHCILANDRPLALQRFTTHFDSGRHAHSFIACHVLSLVDKMCLDARGLVGDDNNGTEYEVQRGKLMGHKKGLPKNSF